MLTIRKAHSTGNVYVPSPAKVPAPSLGARSPRSRRFPTSRDLSVTSCADAVIQKIIAKWENTCCAAIVLHHEQVPVEQTVDHARSMVSLLNHLHDSDTR